jgi:dephospho-CoA kinase
MLTVGITGGIGSGKTTVCKIFKTLGVPVYDADERAKYLLNHDAEIIEQVKKLLGEESYLKGELNRVYVSKKVFNDKKLLEQYNAIVHPAVADDTLKWSQRHSNAPYVLKEAALLVESGAYKFLDKLIVVTAPLEIRIQRVMQRDNVSRESVEARIRNQMDEAEIIKFADFIIVNDGKQALIKQVMQIHHKLSESSKA